MRVWKGVELDPPPVPVVHAAKGHSPLDVQKGFRFHSRTALDNSYLHPLQRDFAASAVGASRFGCGGFGRNNQVRLR